MVGAGGWTGWRWSRSLGEAAGVAAGLLTWTPAHRGGSTRPAMTGRRLRRYHVIGIMIKMKTLGCSVVSPRGPNADILKKKKNLNHTSLTALPRLSSSLYFSFSVLLVLLIFQRGSQCLPAVASSCQPSAHRATQPGPNDWRTYWCLLTF